VPTDQRPPWSCHRPLETEEEEIKKKTCRESSRSEKGEGRETDSKTVKEIKINCFVVFFGCFCRSPPVKKMKRGESYNRSPCWLDFCGGDGACRRRTATAPQFLRASSAVPGLF